MNENPIIKNLVKMLKSDSFKRMSYEDRASKLINTISPEVYYEYKFNKKLISKLKK